MEYHAIYKNGVIVCLNAAKTIAVYGNFRLNIANTGSLSIFVQEEAQAYRYSGCRFMADSRQYLQQVSTWKPQRHQYQLHHQILNI